jgi:hypothetical protein
MIELEVVMMEAKVEVVDGEYILTIRVPNKSTNEWNLGLDEQIAKGKVVTVLDTYANGLEYVQEKVRGVFAVD